MSELRMNAYYYAFEPTGVVAVDRILSAVAAAGKAYHHTEDWCDPGKNGLSNVDYIQQAAVDAAAALTTARADGRREGLEMAAKLADQWSEARLDEANAPILSGDVFTDDGVFVQSTADANAGYRLMDLASAIRALKEEG